MKSIAEHNITDMIKEYTDTEEDPVITEYHELEDKVFEDLYFKGDC